jgi:hypothetical protein
VVESTEVAAVRDEQDFLALIETAIARKAADGDAAAYPASTGATPPAPSTDAVD